MPEQVHIQHSSSASCFEKRTQGIGELQNSSVLESPTDAHAQEQLSVKSATSHPADAPVRDELVMPFLERVVNEVLLRHRRKADLEDAHCRK